MNLKIHILLLCSLWLNSCATHTKTVSDETVVKSEPNPGEIHLRTGYRLWENVVYSPSEWPKELRADIYQPKKTGPWPGVLLIHGGGWAKNDRRDDMVSIARRLAARGYVVMNVTYRLVPEYHYPAPFEDLQEALKWFVAHHESFDLNTEKIAVFGYSAGGHLAALLGSKPLTKGLVRPKAVVAGGAPLDLTKFPKPGLIADFIGDEMAARKADYLDASPINHVTPDDPPVFMYHGKWDLIVPLSQSTDYRKKLIKAGVPNELYVQNGKGHITAFFYDRGAINAAIRFLDKEFR